MDTDSENFIIKEEEGYRFQADSSKWISNYHIGRIFQCVKGYDYGILMGRENRLCHDGNYPHHDGIAYIFKKDVNLFLRQGTFVSFTTDIDIKDEYSKLYITDKSFIALNIFPLKYYKKVYDIQHLRKNLNEGISSMYILREKKDFLDYNYNVVLYYLVEAKGEKMRYIKIVHDCGIIEAIMKLKFFREIINDDLRLYKLIISEMIEINAYIKSLDLEKELATYKVGEKGSFHSPVHKDDYFVTLYYKRMNTNDEYLKTLVPLSEKISYYNCCGRPEPDYDKVDEKETERGKQHAREAYKRELHLQYLLNTTIWRNLPNKITEGYDKYNRLVSEFTGFSLLNKILEKRKKVTREGRLRKPLWKYVLWYSYLLKWGYGEADETFFNLLRLPGYERSYVRLNGEKEFTYYDKESDYEWYDEDAAISKYFFGIDTSDLNF